MTYQNMFVIPYWRFDNLGIDNSRLVEHVHQLRSKTPDKRNPEGYTPHDEFKLRGLKWKSYNLHEKDWNAVPELLDAVNKIKSLVEGCFKELEPKEHVQLELVECWYNLYPPGVGMEIHPHPGNFLSGTYYLQAKEGAGDLVYFNPDITSYYNYASKYFYDRNDVTAVKKFYPPTVGTFTCAPSNIQHAVAINTSDEDRISLSFNFRLKDDNTFTPNHKLFKY